MADSARRPLTCGFVFRGDVRLLFSTSAREGGTDTTAVSPRSRPVPGQTPPNSSWSASAPQTPEREFEAGPRTCYSGHLAESQARSIHRFRQGATGFDAQERSE